MRPRIIFSMRAAHRRSPARGQGTATVCVMACGVPDGVVVSVKDTVAVPLGQISSEDGLTGTLVLVQPAAALEKATVVTLNCAEPALTAGRVSTMESVANGAVVVMVTVTEAAPARSGSVTVMLKGSGAGGATPPPAAP
jgi:hypothetical protein